MTALLSNDASGDMAVSMAVKTARGKLDQGGLTAEETARTQSFIDNNSGKGMADIMRENMRGALKYEAISKGQPQMAETVAAKLDACASTTCLAYVQANRHAELQQVTSGN